MCGTPTIFAFVVKNKKKIRTFTSSLLQSLKYYNVIIINKINCLKQGVKYIVHMYCIYMHRVAVFALFSCRNITHCLEVIDCMTTQQ